MPRRPLSLKWKAILAAAAILVVVATMRGCVATSYLIPSTGMENTLYRGERILVNRWSYGLRLPLEGLWGCRRWLSRTPERGDVVVFNNPANLEQPVIGRREVFIGRCVGLPGDTLMVDSLFCADPSGQHTPDHKSLYAYPLHREAQMDSLLATLHIGTSPLMGGDSLRHVRSFSRYEYYLLQQAIGPDCWLQPLHGQATAGPLRPLVVPRRGKPIAVQPWNLTLLRNTLVLHEGRQADVRHDTLFVDGRPVTQCTFTQDYYWMASDNSVNLTDSRLFGFVPHSHLIGRAARIWFSKEADSKPLQGFRWTRIGQRIE